jgi:DNA-directed RNA polymerase specialized sigma24 family protein
MCNRMNHTDLYLKYAPVIYARCRRFLRSDDEAQEAAGEVFRKLTSHWDEAEGMGGALPWIHRTTARMRLEESRRVRVWIMGGARAAEGRFA